MDGRLVPSVIELYLRAEAGFEAVDYGWDVMVKRDVPATLIEAVVPPDDELVRA